MALSGSFYTNVGSYWRVQGEWTATQNESNNTSTVTLKTYWMTTSSSYGAVYSSASKSGSSTIEGTSESFTFTAGLSNGQKKLVNTQTRTITHNSDGTFPDLDLAVSLGVNVTLGGTYYGTVSASKSFALNTIPRESTLASSPSWTAGNNTTISINRASSSFRHEVDIYVRNSANTSWVLIKQRDFSSSQTSLSSSFSTAEVTEIFSVLAGRASAATRMVVDTYNGSTFIGSTYKEGTVTAPAASHPTTGYDAYQYTDELIDVPISRANSAFTHTVRFKLGSYTKTITGVTTSVSWQPTAAEENSLTAQFPNDTYRTGSIEVDTFYNGVQVRDTQSSFFQFHVRDAHPVFNGSITYEDTNSATTYITENNQYIIQNHSTLSVTLSASSVTPQKNATISGFVFMVAGESITIPYTTSAISRSFGTINATTNQTIIAEAVDSRGFRSAISKIVNVVPYSTPTLSTSAARINGFEADTILKMSGSYSPLKVGTVTTNYLTSLRYRTRERNGTWGSYSTFPYNVSGNSFTGVDQSVLFDITKAYEVEFVANDRIGTTIVTRTVGVGRPIFFIDDVLGSIAMNDFPKDPNTFLLNGRLSFAGNIYASQGEGEVGGAIDLNNGDIVRANGIYFADEAGNSGEGLLFIKPGMTSGSTNNADYDNFYLRNADIYVNNNRIIQNVTGDSTGHFVGLGAGGTTVVGGGESVQAWLDGGGSEARNERMVVANDSYVNIVSNMQNGLASAQTWTFNNNGIMYRPVYKEGNGFQTTTYRISPNHDAPMLFQETTGYLSIPEGSNTAYADFTWPVAYDTTPQSVSVTGRDGNSVNANFGAYNITSTGCRIYASRMHYTSSTFSPGFQILVCGRKA